MPETRSSRMLAVILGASWYPKAPTLAAGKAFRNSAADVLAYLTEPTGLQVPDDNILWLFDDPRSSADQLDNVSTFLSNKLSKNISTNSPENFLLYYVRHGLFTRGERAYCLAVRSTNESNEGSSSIRATDLAALIKEHARFLRRFLILDCCFSGSVYKEFQSAPLTMAGNQILGELPRRGTALLCSSSARDASLVTPELGRTMFSRSFIKALREGHHTLGPHLSLSELADLIKLDLQLEFPDKWVRPEVLSPDQRDGDLSEVPIFPNPAYVALSNPTQWKQAQMAEEERRRAEEAPTQESRESNTHRVEAAKAAQESVGQREQQQRLAEQAKAKEEQWRNKRAQMAEEERRRAEEAPTQESREDEHTWSAQMKRQKEEESGIALRRRRTRSVASIVIGSAIAIILVIGFSQTVKQRISGLARSSDGDTKTNKPNTDNSAPTCPLPGRANEKTALPTNQPSRSSSQDVVAPTDLARARLTPQTILVSSTHPMAQVQALTFSPDGKYLIAAGVGEKLGDSMVQIWNMREHTIVKELPDLAFQIDYSRDGKLWGEAGVIRNGLGMFDVVIRNSNDFSVVAQFNSKEKEYGSVALSTDSRLVAVGEMACCSRPSEVAVFELPSGNLRYELTGLPNAHIQVEFSPDGRFLATGGEEVAVWSAEDGRLIRKLGKAQSMTPIRFSPNGQWLAAVQNNGAVKLWQTQSWTKIGVIGGEKYEDNPNISISPDSQLLISVGHTYGKGFKVWDVRSQKQIQVGPACASVIAFSPTDPYFVAGPGCKKGIEIYQLRRSQ